MSSMITRNRRRMINMANLENSNNSSNSSKGSESTIWSDITNNRKKSRKSGSKQNKKRTSKSGLHNKQKKRTRKNRFMKYKIPKNPRRITNASSSPDICPICLEVMGTNNIATLSCGHKFHFGCICKYASRPGPVSQCPICRTNINIRTPRQSPQPDQPLGRIAGYNNDVTNSPPHIGRIAGYDNNITYSPPHIGENARVDREVIENLIQQGTINNRSPVDITELPSLEGPDGEMYYIDETGRFGESNMLYDEEGETVGFFDDLEDMFER